MQKPLPWSAIVLSVVGLVFSAVAIIAFVSDRQFTRTAIETVGTVTALEARDESSAEAAYAPVITWTDAAGQQRHFTGAVASRPPQYAPGDRVALLYDPGSPSTVKIDSPIQRYAMPGLFGAMGLVFSLLGLTTVIPFLLNRSRDTSGAPS